MPVGLLSAQPVASTARTLDAFDTSPLWRAAPSDGVALDVRREPVGVTGSAMTMAFDFQGRAGYAIARGSIPLGTPGENWSVRFAVKGAMRPNTLEFKLVDASGDNVWWYTIPEFVPSAAWQTVVIRQRQVRFAWGPIGGGPPRNIASIEVVVTAGQGGRGTLTIDDLVFTPLPPDVAVTTIADIRGTGSANGSDPRAAIDSDPSTGWRSESRAAPTLTLDLGGVRTYGGVTIAWDERTSPIRVAVDTSNDGISWRIADSVGVAAGETSVVPLPDGSSRYLRLRPVAGARDGVIGVRDVVVHPLEFASSPSALLASIAKVSAPGRFPRTQYGEQAYWAVVGVSGGRSEALLSEDGTLEPGKRAPSLQPSLLIDGAAYSWRDMRLTQSLHGRVRPIPTVTWTNDDVRLDITAFAAGTTTDASTYVRYRLVNRSSVRRRLTLQLSMLPLQVNPPWQFLNTPGGAARIDSLRWQRGELLVNAGLRVVPLTPPVQILLRPLIPQVEVPALTPGERPARSMSLHDPRGSATALLQWSFDLAPRDSTEITVVMPLDGKGDPRQVAVGDRAPESRAQVAGAVAARLDAVAATWARDQDAVVIQLPASAPPIGEALRANLAWILINRDSAGIQPGSRSYERSWIRDGSLTAEALLRLGRVREAREFAEWYAPFQYASGKVPCCVDARGPDPVDEHDSHGQLIHLVYEVWRYSGDDAFARRMWPHVLRSVAFIDSLRLTHRTPAYDSGALRDYRGLLPASISHEGYSAKPMHSVWDDGFALLGLKEAVTLGMALGHTDAARRIAMSRDTFSADFHEALRRAIKRHGITYVPGSIELGDFDATSTTTLLSPGDELAHLPRAALDSTFARYVRAARGRAKPDSLWNDYTPYEWRTVGALLRLGRADDALALLTQFMGDRRPLAWHQWAEVVWRDPRTPRFIGDMPHTWVGSDFIRSALDLFAYERSSDSALVIAAGVPAAWARDSVGVQVRGLRTPWGPLGYAMRATSTTVTLTFERGLRVPPGGLVITSPLRTPITAATADGADVVVAADGTIVLRRPVRTLTITHQSSP
jgi:hypothetical protein